MLFRSLPQRGRCAASEKRQPRTRRRSLLKKPGLSELLDWAGYMQVAGGDLDDMKGLRAPQLLLKSVPDQKQGDEEFGVVAADEDA